MDYDIKKISYSECKHLILEKHYLRRKTSATYCYGLYDNDKLVGCVTFGNAIPITMKKSVCGEEWMDKVYELNRLYLEDYLPKNTASWFVSRVFKLLPKPLIIVSYADNSVGHNGIVYQALNFYFTGKSHVQKDIKVKGLEHLHSRTLMDEFSFQKDRVKKLKDKYGDRVYYVQRPAKNRYVYFIGSKRDKKNMLKSMRHKPQEYLK